ncbi:FecR domain-containing protein [Mesoterricola silvestris]|uniref:FecR protein domain-containing protein n=1 Tax=Mesoterricola silvestris TaxID=2927979 RepID=A0AA48GU81_9BACT|nr:FecR domain-containing protein [Mesoterricola silvestris]BDU71866.1 hypothetical protein METEAL_10400 [Mesoterricola silvestris]
MIPILVPALAALLQAPAPDVAYRFDQVRRSVELWPGGDRDRAVKAVAGAPARSGDGVRTGWWAETVLSAPEWGSRFVVYGSTRVQLAGGEPGVLLRLERGRILATFEALVGASRRERKVAVPGALLAVRGTRYGLEVAGDGTSTLTVFEGVVEVLTTRPHPAPILVKAGEWSTFGPGTLPEVEHGNARGFEERAWAQGERPGKALGPGAKVPGASTNRNPHANPGRH